MLSKDNLNITSTEIEVVELLAEEGNKFVIALTENGKVTYVSKNTYILGLGLKKDHTLAKLFIDGYESFASFCKNLNEHKTSFTGKISNSSLEIPIEGKIFNKATLDAIWCVFSPVKSLASEFEIQRKIIENSSDVVAYFNADEELVYISPSIFQLTGYTQDEMMHMPQFSLSHSDDKLIVENSIKKDISEKSPLNRFTYRVRHKKGYYTWVEAVSKRNYHEDGSLKEVILSYRSIQNQVEAEKRLQAVEQRYEGIVNQAPFGVVIHDKKKILFANNAASTIIKANSPKDLIGLGIQNMVHPKDRNIVAKRIENLQEDRPAPLREEKFICFDGSYLDVEVMGGAVKFRNLDCVQVLFWDISQRKQVETLLLNQQKELNKTNQALDKFLYSTAHDLRAPIASALGLINLCEQDLNQENIKEYFHMLKLSIEKLDSFIGDISDLSRNAKADLIIEEVDPYKVTNNAVEIVKTIEYDKPVDFDMTWEIKQPLKTDKERLQIIFNNLFSNISRYYNPSSKTVKVRVSGETDKNSCIFSIQDNGIGIPKEYQDKIYDIFYRAHDTKAGSGLGLYIVKETVEKLGGSIKVESDTRKGTCFTIVIPNHK